MHVQLYIVHRVSWVRLQEGPDCLRKLHTLGATQSWMRLPLHGYDHNWVRLQLGVRCYGVRATRGCGYNWVRVVNKGCYNWVWLNLGAMTTGYMRIAHIQLVVWAAAGCGTTGCVCLIDIV